MKEMIYRDKKVISSKNISVGKRVELNTFNSTQNLQKKAEDIEKHILLVESQHNQIIEQLEFEKNRIIEDTKNLSEQIERDAYEKGYKEGQANGYEDGYKEAYEENLDRARFESEAIIQEAQETLLQSNNIMKDYIKENKRNIMNLVISIAEQVLREKFEEKDSMNNLVEKAILDYGAKKSIVVKVNPLYKEELDKKVVVWKDTHNIQDDIFVLGYEGIEKGNVVIETEKGSVSSGIDTVLDALKDELK